MVTDAALLLAAIPSPGRDTVYLGPFPLRAYAVTMILGIVAAAVIGTIRYTSRMVVRTVPLGEEADYYERKNSWKFWNRPGAEDMLDITFWAVPFGIVGARIYHIVTHWQSYFGPGTEWTAIFRVWEGGLAVIGAIAGGAIGAYIVCHRKGIRMPVICDALAPGLLVAQAIGRWGNWFNQELFGRPTTLPWGLQIDAAHLPLNPLTGFRYDVGTLFHPTFLYESLWNLTMAGLVIWIDRRFRLGHGRVFMLYVYLYCLGRTWIEMLRIDSANVIFGLRVNSWAVMILGTLAIIGFCVVGYLHPDREADARRNPPVIEGVATAVPNEPLAAA